MKRFLIILICALMAAAVAGCDEAGNIVEVPSDLTGILGVDDGTENLTSLGTTVQAKSDQVFKIQAEGPTMMPSYTPSMSPLPFYTEEVSLPPGASQSPDAAASALQSVSPSASQSADPTASQSPSASQNPAASASQSAAPTASTSAQPSPTESASKKPSSGVLSGKIIGLDPGHQGTQNSDKEPVAPGSSETKMKVTSGTDGVASGVAEHKVNLQVALKLRDLLENAGATVVMTRTSADVDISNAERAQLFNEKNVDLGIRLHCNGEDDSSLTGAFMLVPEKNPYLADCETAAQIILNAYCERTGLKNKGLMVRGDQTGFNWCERPIINLEMGHMSNAEEDKKLTDPAFQQDMAIGLFDGITEYFS